MSRVGAQRANPGTCELVNVQSRFLTLRGRLRQPNQQDRVQAQQWRCISQTGWDLGHTAARFNWLCSARGAMVDFRQRFTGEWRSQIWSNEMRCCELQVQSSVGKGRVSNKFCRE